MSKWRQKERLKTTAVALVLCLNIGVDPPDVIKISPCARLECWVDPLSMQPPKALETIGEHSQLSYYLQLLFLCMVIEVATAMFDLQTTWAHLPTYQSSVRGTRHLNDGATGKNLQAQYERWQPRAKYKTHLDPTMDDVKKLATSCRRAAKVQLFSCNLSDFRTTP
jgi:regulator-associated protein of mTOR